MSARREEGGESRGEGIGEGRRAFRRVEVRWRNVGGREGGKGVGMNGVVKESDVERGGELGGEEGE